MSERHRIVHIIKVKGVSGAENHLLTLLPKLTEDFDIRLIMLVEKRNSMADFAGEFEKKGVDVTRIFIHHHYDLFTVWRILHIIRKIRPHIAHTHLIHGDVYGLIAARLAGTGIIVSSKHGYDNYDHISPLYRINGLLSGRLDAVITISNALQAKVEAAEGIPRSKMTTIHYGLDAMGYASQTDKNFARSVCGIRGNACLIASVGRLIPVKGYETLIRAVAGINHDFRLLIIGDGPLKKRLGGLVSELNMNHKVLFLGFSPQVSKILSGVDLFVLPTLGEGFGLVLLEAMAHRLPVVATGTMAIPEIVDHGRTGILVPPRNVLALRRAIEDLIRSPDKRSAMGSKGRQRLTDVFSVERMVAGTKRLYSELLEHPAS
ncbi:glycosyltransferase [Thermodesulfobacteriota bacterium]